MNLPLSFVEACELAFPTRILYDTNHPSKMNITRRFGLLCTRPGTRLAVLLGNIAA
jgi:hypothetical protein